MHRSRLANLLVSLATLLFLAVVLAVAEAAVRRLAPETCAVIRREGEQAEHLASLLEPCLGLGARIVRRLQGHGGPHELRIAVIGESSAGLLGERLAAVAGAAPDCDRPTEVLACGQWQGSIEYVRTRLDEVLTYAVPQWLAADPEGAARDLHAFLDAPELATLGPGVRAELVAAVAEGFARAGRWPETLPLAARATALPGASGHAWVARARLHLRHGEATEARAVLDQAPLDAASRADAAALRSVLEEASERRARSRAPDRRGAPGAPACAGVACAAAEGPAVPAGTHAPISRCRSAVRPAQPALRSSTEAALSRG